jgi:hypothetical protein
VLGKPFVASTFFGLFGELLLTLGVVAGERLLSYVTGGWSELAVSIIELVCLYMSHEKLTEHVVGKALLKGLCHLLLALIPWWLALPFHVALDLLTTRWLGRTLSWFIEWLGGKFTLTEDTRATFADFRALWEKIQEWWNTPGSVQVEDFEVELDDMQSPTIPPGSNLMSSAVVPYRFIDAFDANEDVGLSVFVGEERISLSADGIRLLCLRFRPKLMRAQPVINSAVLRGFVLTTSDPITTLSALFTRYSSAPRYVGDHPMFAKVLKQLLSRLPALIPWTVPKFIEHAREHWPQPKVKRYVEALAERNLSPELPSKEISGKANELLPWRNGTWVKTRIVYPYSPAHHVRHDTILWALSVKEILVEHINSTTHRSGDKPPLYLRIPKRGTDIEIEELINSMAPGLLALMSGDDSYGVFKSKKAVRKLFLWTLAADLKSCDTTLGALVKPALDVLVGAGMPQAVADHILWMCEGPFLWKYYGKDLNGDKLTVKAILRIARLNGSGNPFTTILTFLVNSVLHWTAWSYWDGNPNTWSRSLGEAANYFGVRVETEDHGNGTNMNPIGCDTFLSCVPILKESGIVVVIPKCHVKALIIKGSKQHEKGASFLRGIATRAQDPKLTVTHYGCEIRKCFERFLSGRRIPEDLGGIENPYKMVFTPQESPKLTMTEELKYYQNYGQFSMSDFVAELATWSRIDLSEGQGALELPIMEAMARACYGVT